VQAARPGEPLYLYFPTLGDGTRAVVGKRDGSNGEIAAHVGVYHSQLSSGNRLMHQVFTVEGRSEACLVEFVLIKPECPPLEFDLSGCVIAGKAVMPVPNEAQSVFLFLAGLHGPSQFMLKPAGNRLGYRGLDQVMLHSELWSDLKTMPRASLRAAAGLMVEDATKPIELRSLDFAQEVFPLNLAYWDRCISEFVPADNTKEYRFVYGNGDSVFVIPMKRSGASRFAISWDITGIPSTKTSIGMVGIIDESGAWLSGKDIRLLRLKPAESGASFFSIRPDI
jgi:hypothetical protein